MNYGKHGLKVLVLCIMAALGLIAFTAAGAQAGGGEWLIETSPGVKTALKDLGGVESVTGSLEGEKIISLS
jgi:hypothetical protein